MKVFCLLAIYAFTLIVSLPEYSEITFSVTEELKGAVQFPLIPSCSAIPIVWK